MYLFDWIQEQWQKLFVNENQNWQNDNYKTRLDCRAMIWRTKFIKDDHSMNENCFKDDDLICQRR